MNRISNREELLTGYGRVGESVVLGPVFFCTGHQPQDQGLRKGFMFSHKPRWLCAHILTLLMILALGIGSDPSSAFAANGKPDESVVPENGGGGGDYGDPDHPQEPPKFAPGGDPEYGYLPESETTSRPRFGGQVIGRNQVNVWSWRVRFWVAGLRFAYLRF